MTRRFCPRPYDDRGTSLVLALVFITVVSVVVMTVLTFADTSMKSTLALRNQASEMAAAEGAANIALNRLRDDTYTGIDNNCVGGDTKLLLPSFYERPDGTRDSARVTCALDTGPVGTPASALLTLDKTVGPIGISVTNPLFTGPGSLRVTGDVHSNSNIGIVASGNLTSGGTIRANRGCSPGSGLFSPNPTCDTGTEVPDPTYSMPPVAGLPTRTVPPCGPIMTFQSGRYTDYLSLSQRASLLCAGGNGVLHFTPGIYYFDFPSAVLAVPRTWTLAAGTVIGGKVRTGVTLGPGMPVPNSCVSPIPTGAGWRSPPPTDGVTFVFSGGSQMLVSLSAKVELCGRYAGRSAPIAVTAEPANGLLATACVATSWPCAAVWTANPTAFVVQGTTYLPKRELVLNLNSSTNQALRGGVVARRVWANTTRGAGSPAVIETPPDPNSERRTILYLTVYVCPGASDCTSGGQLRLRSKVAMTDVSDTPVAGARQMTVLSWSLQG